MYWLAHPQAAPWAGAVFKYLQTWRWLKPQLNGDDLLRLGVPRGEAVGQCLKRLRAGVLNRQLANRGDEEAFVLAWLQRYSA